MRRFLSAVSCAVILFACSDPASDPPVPASDPPGEHADYVWANPPGCDSVAPAVSLPAAQRDSLPAGLGLVGLDANFYNVAPHVPGGWGGFYMTPVNGRNTPVVLLVDTTDLLAALDTLKKYYPSRSFTRDSSLLRVVRWDWIQLSEWYVYFFYAGLPWDFVYFTDIDEFQNSLRYKTETIAGREAFFQRLHELNVPCWLVAVAVAPDPCKNGGCLK